MAIRASVAAGSHVTYKLLFNDAVAMTGGQATESGFTPAQITRQLAAEGVARTVIVADDPSRYAAVSDLAPGVEVRPRSELIAVQEMLRDTAGTTVLLYDQVCATEKRRRRKRGKLEQASKRVFINPLVCEGCGDCSRASNCVSVEPLDTEFGRKRKINQSSCNQDYSCVDGFCPSFVTIECAENAQATALPALTAEATPLPEFAPLEGVRNIVFTGIGGTGVTTTASILAMAAHVDGRAASVMDMTGLAQKGGAVFSHVRIGRDEDVVVGGRTPAASAHVLVACDILSAAGADALSLYAKDRTAAFANQDFAPTADFVTDRDVKFDSGLMGRKIAAATRSFEECPAHHLAETRFGDAIYANMIMLGFAWQTGQIPVSSRALYRAIRLNGVAADANLQAFELGRQVAHDPSKRGEPEVHGPTPETMELDALIAHRTAELTAYQDAAYAGRYRRQVDRAAEAGSDAFTRAVAVNLYKLMAYKDEYEVARLYVDGRFSAAREATFKGGRSKVWLAPPILAPKDSKGRPRKIAFGGWMLDYGFPLLARLKGLRGTPFDLFGGHPERRLERRLIADYEAGLDRLMGRLAGTGASPEQSALATRIAALPQQIRGYGHVKEASVVKAQAEADRLWAQWDDAAD
jgi:indolepyruvate ferredoxin oxidoreductase